MATGYPGIGGTGGGGGFTLGPAQNVFTASTRALAETARNDYFTDNLTNLASYNADTSLNIRLEYTESGNGTVTYQVRNSAGDNWLDNVSSQGVAGPAGTDGTNGTDGTQLEFGSVTERDDFFAINLNLLRANLPILVTVAVETVSSQIWTGQTNPATYESHLWRVASIRSGTASFELDEIHTFSSGGQQVFVTNEASGISFFTAQQFVGDHTVPSRRVASNTLMSRQYAGDLTQAPPPVELGGPAASSGTTPFDVTFDVQGASTSLNGLMYIPTEDYTGRLEYSITELDSGNDIVEFTQTLDVILVDGIPFTQWFRIPSEVLIGDNARARLIKADGTTLNVRPEAGDLSRPYSTTYLRLFTDVPVLISNQAANQLDPVILVGGGISKVVDTDSNTITLTGSTQPSIHQFTSDIPSRVDVNTNLNVQHTFNFSITNHSQITDMNLVVSGGDDKVLSLPTTDGEQSQSVTLTGIGTGVPTSLTFRVSDAYLGGTVSSNVVTVQVADPVAHEQVHFGFVDQSEDETDINFAIDDILQRGSPAGDYSVTGLPNTGQHRLYFAVPVALPSITSIRQGGFDITNQFTPITNITITGEQYNIQLMDQASSVNSNYNGSLLTVEV